MSQFLIFSVVAPTLLRAVISNQHQLWREKLVETGRLIQRQARVCRLVQPDTDELARFREGSISRAGVINSDTTVLLTQAETTGRRNRHSKTHFNRLLLPSQTSKSVLCCSDLRKRFSIQKAENVTFYTHLRSKRTRWFVS